MSGELSDAELLRRHVAGVPDAFDELVRRHRDRLWRLARATTGDREDAADAVQEALLSAYRNASSFRGESSVSTWLHRIVVNACYDIARRRAARPTVPLDPVDAERQPGRDDAAERGEALAVWRALAALPPEHAAAAALVYVEGYPVAEAAAILGVPEGTVKSRCARARARLAVLLADPPVATGNPPDAHAVPPAGVRTAEQPPVGSHRNEEPQ